MSAGGQVIRLDPVAPAHRARVVAERVRRVRDVVHRHGVDRRRGVRGDRGEQTSAERAQRPVEHVEGGRPAGAAIADDDAGRRMRAGQPGRGTECLGLELRLLVGVAEPLAEVVVVLGEGSAVITRDVRGRDVAVAVQPAPRVAASSASSRSVPGALDVDRAGLGEPQRERHGRRAVDDRGDPLGDLLTGVARESEVRSLPDRRPAPRRESGTRRPARRTGRPAPLHPRLRRIIVRRANEREHRAVGSLQASREELHPDEAGRAGEQHVAAHRLARPLVTAERAQRPAHARPGVARGDQLVDVPIAARRPLGAAASRRIRRPDAPAPGLRILGGGECPAVDHADGGPRAHHADLGTAARRTRSRRRGPWSSS